MSGWQLAGIVVGSLIVGMWVEAMLATAGGSDPIKHLEDGDGRRD